MEITVDIDETVGLQLRDEVGRQRTSMSALVEAGLRRVLRADTRAGDPGGLPPLPRWNSGGHLVNIDNREELYQAMDGDEFYPSLEEG